MPDTCTHHAAIDTEYRPGPHDILLNEHRIRLSAALEEARHGRADPPLGRPVGRAPQASASGPHRPDVTVPPQ